MLPFSMFFVELKPAPNNKHIFIVEYIQHCEIKSEPSKRALLNVQKRRVRTLLGPRPTGSCREFFKTLNIL
jgi:hypothetical protein